jgi:hypothetical protein
MKDTFAKYDLSRALTSVPATRVSVSINHDNAACCQQAYVSLSRLKIMTVAVTTFSQIKSPTDTKFTFLIEQIFL